MTPERNVHVTKPCTTALPVQTVAAGEERS